MAMTSRTKRSNEDKASTTKIESRSPKTRKHGAPSSETPRSGKRPKTEKGVIEEISENFSESPNRSSRRRQKTTTSATVSKQGLSTTVVELAKSELQYNQDYKGPIESTSKAKAVFETAKSVESPKKAKRSKKSGGPASQQEEDKGTEDSPKKATRHRKTKEEKEAEAMPLAARTNGLKMFIGAHVSCAKGVQNAVTNAVHIGGNSFALFLKSQRKWENPPLQDDHKSMFHANCTEHSYDAAQHVLPHGSYLVNLAQEDPDKAKQAYNGFIDDLHRCENLGIKLYNFHPGNTGPSPRPAAITRIANAINRAHKETKLVKPVLENMAGSGNVIGSAFEDLRDIIEQVDDKSRIGVCIDTCHTFEAGYDLRTPEAFRETFQKFDDVVGMRYLSALHLNDSKAPFASHRDLHQNIGLGFLGLGAFHCVMNEPRFQGLPMVLETPIDRKSADGKDIEDKGVWATEIKLLESLIGMDPDGQEFKALEADLAGKGTAERRKLQDVHDRKLEKDQKAAEKGKGKGRTKRGKKGAETEDSGSDG